MTTTTENLPARQNGNGGRGLNLSEQGGPPPGIGYQRAALKEFPGLYVTTYGEVFTTKRPPKTGDGWFVKVPEELPQSYAGRGYRKVSIWSEGKTHTRYVHQLVAEAFVPGKAPGLQVRHWDGEKENNCAENLLWGTPKQNGEDSVRQGLSTKGERDAMAKLTSGEVVEIRRLLGAGGMSQREIGERFNVSQSLISMIGLGQIWGHV